MACEYYSYSVFEQFTDAAILGKALQRVKTQYNGRVNYWVNGLQVEAEAEVMNSIKQSYQVEAARAALKKKGFFVTETRQENGKIKLTVRA